MKWKKGLIAIFVLLLLLPASFALAANQQETTVYINKKELSLNVPPQISDGQLMVPMRPFLEALGVDVNWDSETNKVTAQWAGKTVVMGIRHTQEGEEGEQKEVPLQVYKGVTMIPIDFVLDFLGLDVRFDREQKIVEVEKPDYIYLERFSGKDAVPKWLENWVESTRDHLDIQYRIRDNRLYLLSTFGEKNTSGYNVRVSRITRQEDAFIAEIIFKDSPSLSTLQVITRPYDLVYVDLDSAGSPRPSALIFKIRGLKDGKAKTLPMRIELADQPSTNRE